MKVVMDEKIPYLREALLQMGMEVVALPGVAICRADVADADALFVRTRTLCGKDLLEGSHVKFIGTATIGHDHIDSRYCADNGILWCNAAGCNADAVLQYVQSVVYQWALERGRSLAGLSMGVVGVGEIGGRVAAWAESAGMVVLKNDPLKAASGRCGYVSLDEIAAKSDIITFHPSLVRTGDYPSYHLAGADFFASLGRCSLLINASRGPVVDNAALFAYMCSYPSVDVVLDVWEGEPHIDMSLLDRTFISTPHIAGYSAEGKMNATRMVLEAFVSFIGYRGAVPQLALPAPDVPVVSANNRQEALLRIYSPVDDSRELKENPSAFEELRNNYRLRREPSAYTINIVRE